MKKAEGRNSPGRAAGNSNATGRRAELLAIAGRLFATRGFAQTTVRDIGDEAGILSGSLYHHFSSKEEILDQVLHEFMDGLYDRFRVIVAAEVSPRAALDALIRSSFLVIHEQTDAVALYQNEASRLPEQSFAYVNRRSDEIEKMWIEVLEAGVRSGDFREGLAVPVVYRFVRDSLWSAVRWYKPRGRLRHDIIAEQYLDFIHGGLLAK
jgi:TetR/AcrR family transcriptional regulator, cholesterol catabolism regulator